MTKNSRHTSAFLLLFLAQEPAYGASLLTRMQKDLPFCFSDSPSVYRSLRELEENGWVETRWENSEGNKPLKWYYITPQGLNALQDYHEDIMKRNANFLYFLEHYAKLKIRKEIPDVIDNV